MFNDPNISNTEIKAYFVDYVSGYVSNDTIKLILAFHSNNSSAILFKIKSS